MDRTVALVVVLIPVAVEEAATSVDPVLAALEDIGVAMWEEETVPRPETRVRIPVQTQETAMEDQFLLLDCICNLNKYMCMK